VTIGRSAATQGDELRLGLAIELPRDRSRGALLARQGRSHSRAYELLTDSHNLPLTQPDRLGNLMIGLMALWIAFVGHQQDPRSTQLRCGRTLLPAEQLQLRSLRARQMHAKLLVGTTHPCAPQIDLEFTSIKRV
jgi:hypothetical protein